MTGTVISIIIKAIIISWCNNNSNNEKGKKYTKKYIHITLYSYISSHYTNKYENGGGFTSTPGMWISKWPSGSDLSRTAAPEESGSIYSERLKKKSQLTAGKSAEGGKWNYCTVGPTHAKRKHSVHHFSGALGAGSAAAGNPGLDASSGFDLGSGKEGGRAFISEAPQSDWLKPVWIHYSRCLSVPWPEKMGK